MEDCKPPLLEQWNRRTAPPSTQAAAQAAALAMREKCVEACTDAFVPDQVIRDISALPLETGALREMMMEQYNEGYDDALSGYDRKNAARKGGSEMGSGDRFTFGVEKRFALGFSAHTFPFALTLTLFVGPFWVSYGFGKGYDQ